MDVRQFLLCILCPYQTECHLKNKPKDAIAKSIAGRKRCDPLLSPVSFTFSTSASAFCLKVVQKAQFLQERVLLIIIRKLKITPTALSLTQLRLCLHVFSMLVLFFLTGSSKISLMYFHLLVVHQLLHYLLHFLQWQPKQWLGRPYSQPLNLR